jgi:putative glutathione S-transferase
MVYIENGVAHPGYRNNISKDGSFVRQPTKFHGNFGTSEHPIEKNRYHIYAAHGCPWAHRVLLYVSLKGLRDVFTISFVAPRKRDECGWEFDEEHPDPLFGKKFLYEIYVMSDPHYTGSITCPVVFDKITKTIVNNESSKLIRELDSKFSMFSSNATITADLYPENLATQIDELNDTIYHAVNNGVYKTGFAKTQELYEHNCNVLFDELDEIDDLLGKQRYLCGNTITEADWRLFVTLIRFDPVYYFHFKCNVRRIQDYPNLKNYTRELYQMKGVAETIDFDKICEHYYWSHDSVNPKRTSPVVKHHKFVDMPHDRRWKFPVPEVDGAEAASLRQQSLEDAGEVQFQGSKTTNHWRRPTSNHRRYITADGSSEFPAESGRYHLYIANNCPWSHRCVLVRELMKLHDVISMDVLMYRRDPERGWQFNPDIPGCTEETVLTPILQQQDPNKKVKFLREIYEYCGSSEKSVPLLIDKKQLKIVSNESAEIIRMFAKEFSDFTSVKLDLLPENMMYEIDALNSWIYQEIANGAYKAGFTSSQEAYEAAFHIFFQALDKVECLLKERKTPFLCGHDMTEADVRLFPTIFRFDRVYYMRFKLNQCMISDGYPFIQQWMERMYTYPGVAKACNISHCRNGYFGRTGNNLIPVGPVFNFEFAPDDMSALHSLAEPSSKRVKTK